MAVDKYRIDPHAADKSESIGLQHLRRGERGNRKNDGARVNRRSALDVNDEAVGFLDASDLRAEPHGLLRNRFHQPVDQLRQAVRKRAEDAIGVERAALATERLDDAAGPRLGVEQPREQGPHRQALDVAGMNAGEQRLRDVRDRFGPEPPAHESRDRLVLVPPARAG